MCAHISIWELNHLLVNLKISLLKLSNVTGLDLDIERLKIIEKKNKWSEERKFQAHGWDGLYNLNLDREY